MHTCLSRQSTFQTSSHAYLLSPCFWMRRLSLLVDLRIFFITSNMQPEAFSDGRFPEWKLQHSYRCEGWNDSRLIEKQEAPESELVWWDSRYVMKPCQVVLFACRWAQVKRWRGSGCPTVSCCGVWKAHLQLSQLRPVKAGLAPAELQTTAGKALFASPRQHVEGNSETSQQLIQSHRYTL